MDIVTSWTAAHAVVLIPLVFLILTSILKGPDPIRIAAATGGARVLLIIWSDAILLLNATGVSAPMIFAWIKKRFFTPKPPALPPPLPPAPMPSKDVLSGDDIAYVDDTNPSMQAPPVPASSVPPLAAARGLLARIFELVTEPFARGHRRPGTWREGLFAAAAVFVVWSGFAGFVTACGALSSVQTYAPTPADEMGVVSYGGAQEECLALDASKADKVACVHAVRCAAGREDAASCVDAGGDAGGLSAAACLADGGVFACVTNTDCTCSAKRPLDAALDAPADAAAARELLVHETIIRAESK